MKIFKAILAQLSFFTIIPSISAPLEEIARFSFTAPLIVGVFTGVLDFIFLYIFHFFLGNTVFLLLIPFVEIIRGFHHLDGLLDYGDALMVKDYQKKLKVLHDVQTGSGAIGLLLVYVTIFAVATLNLKLSVFTLLSAEVLSRASAISILALLPPIEGSFLAKVFYDKLNGKWWKFILIQLEALLFSSLPLLLAYLLLTVFFFVLCKRTLKGSSGDYVGFVITLSFPIYLLVAEKLCCQFSILQLLLILH